MISIVLADTDEAYIDRLGNFIAAKFGGRAEVAVFTKPERLKKHLDGCKGVDILLSTHEFANETAGYDRAGMKFILCDYQPEDESGNRVFKYKPASILLEEILSKYAKTGSETLGKLFKGNRRTKIIVVHSARGSCGKTLISLALCMQLSRLGISALYLNLETVTSLHYYLNDSNAEKGSDGMTALLYHLKQDIGRVPLKFDAAVSNDSAMNIAFMQYPNSAFELSELTPADLSNLLYQVKSIGKYDAVVIDTKPGLGEDIACILSHCDAVVYVLTQEAISFYKQRVLEKEISKYPGLRYENTRDRSVYIINRYAKERNLAEKDRNPAEERFSADEFEIPVLRDIFVHNSRAFQVNPRGSLLKALEAPVRKIVEKAGISPAMGISTELPAEVMELTV